MSRAVGLFWILLYVGSCSTNAPVVVLPTETRFAFTNLSRRFYAALAVRGHTDLAGATAFKSSPLLPPGATFRTNFADLVKAGCPGSLDLRVFLYKRIHEDTPIGLDPGEAVEPTPIAAGEIQGIPACDVEALETYTVVNWDADEGTARVKIAQDTAIDDALRASGVFPNVDAAWEVHGVDPALAAVPPPAPAPADRIAGHVTLRNGTGAAGIGVLVRTRFRVRLDDTNLQNDPDAGFGDPIAIAVTDAAGAFSLDRPAGAYRIEVFADGYLFRPVTVDVETPLSEVTFIAEPQ